MGLLTFNFVKKMTLGNSQKPPFTSKRSNKFRIKEVFKLSKSSFMENEVYFLYFTHLTEDQF